MPPVQQDKLTPIDTLISFENFNNTPSKRVLHNGTDILKLTNNNTITYFQSDGEEKVSYSLPRTNVLDITYSPATSGYYIASLGTDTISGVLASGISNSGTVLTTGTITPINPNEDFSTGVGTYFNTDRWEDLGIYLLPIQSGVPYKSFRRQSSQQNLAFNTIITGGDKIRSLTTLSGNLDVSLNYNVTTISGNKSYFGLTIQEPDLDLGTIGVCMSGSNKKYYTAILSDVVNLSRDAYITDVSIPYIGGLTSGSNEFRLNYSGVSPVGLENDWVWKIDSNINGAGFTTIDSIRVRNYSITGTTYSIDISQPTKCPVAFTIYNPSIPDAGDFIGFTINYNLFPRTINSGTLNIKKSGSYINLYGEDINPYSSGTGFTSNTSRLYIDGSCYHVLATDQINLVADNLIVNSGYNPTPYDVVKTVSTLETTVSSINVKYFYTTLDQIQGDGDIEKTLYSRLLIGTNGYMQVKATGYIQTTSGDYYSLVPINTTNNISLNSGYTTASSVNAYSGNFGLAYNPSNSLLYMGCFDSIKMIPVPTGTTITGYTNETFGGSGITAVSGVLIHTPYYSFNYSNTRGGFLSYVNYDSGVDSLKVNTLTKDNPPVNSDNKIFLDIPDWSEQVLSGSSYQVFYQQPDNNTLFYIRKHGATRLNGTKVSSSTGNVSITGTVFTDSTKNFSIQTGDPSLIVKLGDTILINRTATAYTSNGVYRIVNINNSDLTLDRTLVPSVTANLPYIISSNAELMQINADENITAFASVNVSDFNLRAGSLIDTSTITAQVINAWGDPLGNKRVDFAISTGQQGGILNPQHDMTTSTGVDKGTAESVYTPGLTAGTVQIQVTVSD